MYLTTGVALVYLINLKFFLDSACEVCKCEEDKGYGGIYVDCRNRKLHKVPSGIPRKVTTLDLGGNLVTRISSTDLNNLPELTALHLYDNKLLSLPRNLFKNKVKLTWLNLSVNNLKTLPDNILKNNVKLTALFLSYNPLICSCTLYHNLVDIIPRLNKWWLSNLGTCDGNVKLMKMTKDNEHVFCSK